MTTHEYQSAQDKAEKTVLKIEAVSPDDPARIDLTTDDDGSTRHLDIFVGDTEALTESATDDPNRFMVVDLQHMPRDENGKVLYEGQKLASDVCYLMIQPASLDWSRGKGYKGIRFGEVVDMGRKQEQTSERFNFTQMTSANHFTIAADKDGTLLLADRHSTNGTAYQIVAESPKQVDVEEVTRDADRSTEETHANELLAEFQVKSEPVPEVGNIEGAPVQGDLLSIDDGGEASVAEDADEQLLGTEGESALDEVKNEYETDEALLHAANVEYKRQIQGVIDEFNETVTSRIRRLAGDIEEVEGSLRMVEQTYDSSLNDLSQLIRRIDNGEIDSRGLNIILNEVQGAIDYARRQFMRSQESIHTARLGGSAGEDIDSSVRLLARKQAEFVDFMGAHGQEIEATDDTVALRNEMSTTRDTIEQAFSGLSASELASEDMAYALTRALSVITELMARPNRGDLAILLTMLQSVDISSVTSNVRQTKDALEGIRGIEGNSL